MKPLRISRLANFALFVMTLAPTAPGRVVGTLIITSDSGGVTITATSIDWTPPEGPPDGRFIIGLESTMTYDSGTLLPPGFGGTILDLDAAMPFPVFDFMTFDAAPEVALDLSRFHSGPPNTMCAVAFDPNAPPCSISAFSPFALQSTSTGTVVTLSGSGPARDGASTFFIWNGNFTIQIAGRTPADIQTNMLEGGSETGQYSGEFAVIIPEPNALSLLVLGGCVIAFHRRWSCRLGEPTRGNPKKRG